MTRSFGNVESKLFEADFFLDKILESKSELREPRYYLSAFLAASRSITFALQACMSGADGFDLWYSKKSEMLKKDKRARYFVEARNESQKLGIYHIGGGTYFADKDDKPITKYYFSRTEDGNAPNDDVATACKAYYMTLLEIIFDCFQQFGPVIDPEQYYTLKNMKNLGKTIEDFEEELGFPRGWTAVGPETERIRALSKSAAKTDIDYLFIKYFNKNRFGKKVLAKR